MDWGKDVYSCEWLSDDAHDLILEVRDFSDVELTEIYIKLLWVTSSPYLIEEEAQTIRLSPAC